jgi:hypothetical protein
MNNAQLKNVHYSCGNGGVKLFAHEFSQKTLRVSPGRFGREKLTRFYLQG